MNKVIIIGRNTKDIELRQTPSGVSAIEFSIAVKRTFKNANGEYESDFFDCIAFSKLAETISRYVKKGDQVGIEGENDFEGLVAECGKKRRYSDTETELDEVGEHARERELAELNENGTLSADLIPEYPAFIGKEREDNARDPSKRHGNGT